MTSASRRMFAVFVASLAACLAGPAVGSDLEKSIARLERLVAQQQDQIAEHERILAEQAKTIAQQQQELWREPILFESASMPVSEMLNTRGAGNLAVGPSVGQAEEQQRTPVGKPPPKKQRSKPQVQAIADIGGVLTPKGTLTIEPALQYSHADVNRLTFRGIELLGALGIGLLSADDADRDVVVASLTGRYGISNRLEAEVKLPYVYRDDTLTNRIPQIPDGSGQPAVLERDLDGNGLGDIELALHYQINAGLEGWPIFVGNLRYKSATGEGPFDVDFDSDGIATELPMGSGFHSIEPSVTVLYPSDPAVFFANLGYVYSIEDDVDKMIGELRVRDVDPGDTVRLSFGMAYSINERTSFTLGYKNDFFQKTETEFSDPDTGLTTKQSSDTLNIGALLLGYSFQLDPKTSVNLNLELGITDDAPDVLMTVRVPFQLDL